MAALNYNIKGTGLSVSDEIRGYVEKRLARIEKMLGDDKTAHIDIELQFQTTENRQRYRAELTLSSHSELYRAEAFGDSLHEAIDLAEGELSQELRHSKSRDQRFVRRNAARFKDFIRGFRNKF